MVPLKKTSPGLDLTFEQILTGILLDKDTNHAVTLCAFWIYKEWLLNHNSVAHWLKNDIVLFIKSELKIYILYATWGDNCNFKRDIVKQLL